MRLLLARFTIAGALLASMTIAGLGAADVASAATTNTLSAGQQLSVGQSLVSSDGRYNANMQSDGNFVVYGPNGATWSIGGAYGNGTAVAMQTDGNLVAYAPGQRAVWSSNTSGTGSSNRLIMQNDGNLVIVSSGGIAIWSSFGGLTGNHQDTLAAGQQLSVGQSLKSSDGRYNANMQGDGNFVVYGQYGATWSIGGAYGNGTYVAMQTDGNLVAYAPGPRAVWSSNTSGSGSTNRLIMQSDGNLVIVSSGGIAIWSSLGGRVGGGGSGVQNFKAWALDRANWNSTTPAGNPGIDSDGLYGAQCADLGIAWSKQAGHRVGFDGNDTSSSSKPGWRYVSGNFGAAQPGDVITRVGGKQHVVVVVGSPSGGSIPVLQQNPGSPAAAGYSTSTSGVIWRLN